MITASDLETLLSTKKCIEQDIRMSLTDKFKSENISIFICFVYNIRRINLAKAPVSYLSLRYSLAE